MEAKTPSERAAKMDIFHIFIDHIRRRGSVPYSGHESRRFSFWKMRKWSGTATGHIKMPASSPNLEMTRAFFCFEKLEEEKVEHSFN